MLQTQARQTLKDAPVMWRRINSIGMILDCNSTYATSLGYAKSEILGKSVFEHVPKESRKAMNDSLKTWFRTGKVTDRKIEFRREDGSTFPGLLQATSLYDENSEIIGSNTVIFDLTKMSDAEVIKYEKFFKEANARLAEIGKTESSMDDRSRSEYNGLKKMFEMLLQVDLRKLDLI